MVQTGATVDEAVRRYLSGLSEAQRGSQQTDLGRFVRWAGADTRLESLKAEDVERYQEQVERSGADVGRLEAVRTFLTAAHKQGQSALNLGKYIKLKRTAAKKANAAKPEARADQPESEAGEHITREGYDALKQELDYLTNTKRAEIAATLYEARLDKDIRENAPFDAAKQHQAEVEARIRHIERVLATAQIVEQKANGNRVGLGTIVVLRDLTHGDELTYTLVGTSEANPRLGRISIVSPVGRALLDRRAGEEFDVEAPAGRIRYRVERVES
jgi:transcription elongation factor GreA